MASHHPHWHQLPHTAGLQLLATRQVGECTQWVQWVRHVGVCVRRLVALAGMLGRCDWRKGVHTVAAACIGPEQHCQAQCATAIPGGFQHPRRERLLVFQPSKCSGCCRLGSTALLAPCASFLSGSASGSQVLCCCSVAGARQLPWRRWRLTSREGVAQAGWFMWRLAAGLAGVHPWRAAVSNVHVQAQAARSAHGRSFPLLLLLQGEAGCGAGHRWQLSSAPCCASCPASAARLGGKRRCCRRCC